MDWQSMRSLELVLHSPGFERVQRGTLWVPRNARSGNALQC